MHIEVVDYQQSSEDYQRVEQAIHFLEENYERQPSLSEIADSVHLSEYHFQRLFQRWVGVSPKRFLQHLTKEQAKQLLRQSTSLLETSYETGLSGPGRLHDLFVTWEAVTPGEFKHRGAGLQITYGFHPTPFGDCLIATTERGICSLSFVESGRRDLALRNLKASWSRADLLLDVEKTAPVVRAVFTSFYAGRRADRPPVVLYGTNHQLKVWEALLRIPPGSLVTYEDIAVYIGLPEGARAVGSAVGRNPVPVLIPCHRVIRKDGRLGGYRYGLARKKALLGWESAKASPAEGYTSVTS